MSWLNGPIGMGAGHRVLRVGCRSVLVVVPFVAASTWLMDVLPLLESDHRVRVAFTVAPADSGATCHGADAFLRTHGGPVLPWHQAIRCRFDLILAASPTGVDQLHGKILLLPHGAGSRAPSAGTDALDREALMRRGRLVPSALALAHDSEITVLRTSCPEALRIAGVAGDICFDRLTASLPAREQYRRALRLDEAHKLIAVTSTWQHPDLLDQLVRALPPSEYRIAAVSPEESWRAVLVAADLVIGDYGSVTRYGAALGKPTLLAAMPEQELRPDTAVDVLRRHAPRLRTTESLIDQIRGVEHDSSWQNALPSRITSRPGQAGRILRQMMYHQLDIPEPLRAAPVSAVPLPEPITPPVSRSSGPMRRGSVACRPGTCLG